MKKSLSILLSVFSVSLCLSQPLRNKNGEVILPQKGDWSIGIDAAKFIKVNTFNFISDAQTITGKYMKDSATAYRVGVRLGFNEWTSIDRVVNRAAASSSVVAFPAPVQQNNNIWKRTSVVIGLSAGIEKRRGSTRLQGIYGAEAGIFIGTSKDKFTYANKLNASAGNHIVVDPTDVMRSPLLGNANNIDTLPPVQGVLGSARVLERKNGTAVSLAARGFIGAEYFFLPKMSIGGEFGWGLAFTTSGRSEILLESEGVSNLSGSTTPSIRQTTIDGDSHSHFSLDTDNSDPVGGFSASLKLNLYF